MLDVFNSVKGLHPILRAYSAHSYRNDFTMPLGVIVPCYIQDTTAKVRVLCKSHALVRTMPMVAPVMDNIDYYVHFWQIPYRLIENDKFTAFISGELENAEDYNGNGWFFSPYDLMLAISNRSAQALVAFEKFFVCDGGLFDMLGYDASLFGYDNEARTWDITKASKVVLNWRRLVAYTMLMLHWYMNENVPYWSTFVQQTQSFFKEGVAEFDEEHEVYVIKRDFVNFFTELMTLNLKPGTHNPTDGTCSFFPHGWAKDYFTSALPNTQYGSPVTLPLAGTAPVAISGPATLRGRTDVDGNLIFAGQGLLFGPDVLDPAGLSSEGTGSANAGYLIDQQTENPVKRIEGQLSAEGVADMSQATAITINELRFAAAFQTFKERQLKFGRRRLEYYKGFFDVTPEDLRLQVPRFLGGGRIPINVSDVEQTSESSEGNPLGTLAGKGTAVAGGFAGFNAFCSEETLIIGLCFAMPTKTTYSNGLSRFIMKTNDVFDYFNPSFQHLGEQSILKMELYAGATNGTDEFGYTPRYNEYRFHANEQHGAFKNTLNYWTLGRIFHGAPSLSPEFIYMKPWFFNRIFAYDGLEPLLVSQVFSVRMLQPVSKYGTPMLLG